MKKILYRLVLLTSALGLSLPLSTFAATVTFNADTTLSLPNGISLTVLSGSVADELIVNADSSLTLTVGADTDITIRSNNSYSFSSSVGTQTCVGGSYNQIRVTTPAGTYTILTSTTPACSADSGGSGPPATGGGGGGGGGTAPAAPTSTSVSVNSGDAQTQSPNVTLTLGATNASLMLIANKADFSDASGWVAYTPTLAWTLTDGAGTKTVYAKFRSSGGGESAAVSYTIERVAPSQPVTGDVIGQDGGTVALSDGKASVTFPAGAFSGTGSVTITPTSTYSTVPSGWKLVGTNAFDFTLLINQLVVKTFSKPVVLTFSYSNGDVSGIDESTLAVFFWDSATNQWMSLGGTVDLIDNHISANSTHFTLFAVFGKPATTSAGQLVKLACANGAGVNDPCKAVYYVGNNGKRYVFPNSQTYYTWYADFSGVVTVSAATLASYQIGGNVTYRPGVRMIKIQSDPKVYAVGSGGSLRWVATEAVAQALYGATWNTKIDDLSSAFFANYSVGADLATGAEFDKAATTAAASNINVDKGL